MKRFVCNCDRCRNPALHFCIPHCTPVSALAFLYGRGGFTLALGTTATIALGFVFATAVIAVLVNGVEKARARVAPAE
jgi:hypothetical protein